MRFTKTSCVPICGKVVTALSILALTGCDLPPRAKHGPRITSYYQLYEVGLAIRSYEHQHGELPLYLSALVPDYIATNQISIFYVTNKFAQQQSLPLDWKDNPTQIDRFSSYVYLGTNSMHGIIAYEKTNLWKSTTPNPDRVAVLFSDFHVQYVPTTNLQTYLR